MLVASIDVGIVNLALIVVCVDAEWRVVRVVHAEVTDTRVLEHRTVSAEACLLGHTKTATDRLTHFVQNRAELLDACDKVLIERQPIQGHTDVQELLFLMFRAKAELVSPNSMHKHFNIGHYTYEGRKQQTVAIAEHFFHHQPGSPYHTLERKHDIADALCLCLFWLSREKAKQAVEVKPKVYECVEDDHQTAVAKFAASIQKFRAKLKK
jgi:hypothetical protein